MVQLYVASVLQDRLPSTVQLFILYLCVVLHQRYLTSNNKDHEQLFDLIEKMLDYDPAKRLTLDQCLQHPFFSCYHQNSTNSTEDRTVEL